MIIKILVIAFIFEFKAKKQKIRESLNKYTKRRVVIITAILVFTGLKNICIYVKLEIVILLPLKYKNSRTEKT